MKANKRSLAIRIAALVFLLFSCFYMYDFYKSLSGFIANGFREPLNMLPMITAFFLPVICFLFFVYDYFVRAINPVIKVIYSAFVILYGIADLVLIFRNIGLYASNNSLGVYDALPSIIIHFPYDMIVVISALVIWQTVKLIAGKKISSALDSFKENTLKLGIVEYIILSIFAIIIFVFTSSGICATFTSFKNAFYDIRFIYILLWVALIPMMNLVLVTVKPRRALPLIVGIAANIIFGALFWIFEATYPDFLVHIGKPLFLIAFSISIPIEPVIIFGIMALGTLVLTIRLIRNKIKK